MRTSGIIAAAALFASSVLADLDPIVIKGSKFFYKSNGTQFFMRGIAYQQEAGGNGSSTGTSSSSGVMAYKDPLADPARCQIDIPLMKKLRTNTIRVYAIDPAKNHDVCMQLLIDNGIYIVADLSEPGLSINRDTPMWNEALLTRYTRVVDFFSKYSNVIGYFAGNEVSNQQNNTAASAFVKAAVRDTKAYIKTKGYRTTYVGYATADDAQIRENMANYFNCGDQAAAIDFWGYNIYSWCGDSSFTTSGFDQRVKEFQSYSVPTFFAEYGCNTVQPRGFTEVASLYSSDMTGVFSGGIVYMYFQEDNNYGLVDVRGGSASLRSDYTALSSQMALAEPTGVQMGSYNPTNTAAACPAVATSSWAAKASPLPPTPDTDLCKCMYDSLSCVVRGTVPATNYGQIFGLVCGLGGGSACAGIKADAATGSYGAYSMCNSNQMLSFALDQYYKSQQSAQSACNFQGAAVLKNSVAPPSSCAAKISQAGPAGTGIVTSNPIGASNSGSGSTKKAAAASVTPDLHVFGMFIYVTIIGLLGAGMILA